MAELNLVQLRLLLFAHAVGEFLPWCAQAGVESITAVQLLPSAQGTVVELRQTEAVIQDGAIRRRWGVPYAAIIPDAASGPDHIEQPSPPRTQREAFFIGDTVGFTDKHLSERVGIIVG